MPENEVDTVTLGEVYRGMNRLFAKIDVLGHKLDKVPRSEDVDRLQSQINELKSWQTWALRIVVGGVILAFLGAVIVTKT